MNPQGTTSGSAVVLDVAGQKIRLAASTDASHVQRLAAMVNDRVAGLQKGARAASPSTMLALVALEMADEVLRARQQAEAAEERARGMIAEVEARAREVEQAARRAVADALAEIDRALEADDACVRAATHQTA